MERVCRLARHGLPAGHFLSSRPPLSPDQIRAWARYAESSPLYTHLVEVIAADERLVDLLNAIENPPRHNVFFAGVQYLMARDGAADLAPYYASFTEDPADTTGVDVPFVAFVLANAEELIEIGRTRYAQTNESRRCTALLPGIWATPADRFHLVDLGTSAGLNLQLDRYSYTWGDISWGPDSPVHLDTAMHGEQVLPREIEVLTRVGLDLNPIDPVDPDSRMWLEALVWPEHRERRARLQLALDLAAASPPELVAGDALATLGPVIDELAIGAPVVVLNSFILNQFAQHDRARLDEIVEERRATRRVYRVSLEWLDRDAESAWLEVDDGSGPRRVGAAQPHGEWLELYARP